MLGFTMSQYVDISNEQIFSLLKENTEDQKRSGEIRKFRDTNYNPYPNGWNLSDFFKETFDDMYVDGFIMKYPHGTVVRQAQRSYYYRGENQIFETTQASLFRKLKNIENPVKQLAEEFAAFMRIADFLELLLKLQHTQKFITQQFSFENKFFIHIDLLYEQLAQHYGFETHWLDITSDFEVALFFACCKFNSESYNWEPLSNKDFNSDYKTQYGVIFQRPTNHFSNFHTTGKKSVNIFPVGFQPFMRCYMQNSYVALMDKSHCLQQDRSFRKLRFKHSEELSNFIFNRMDCGKKIYPHEGLNILKSEIEEIRNRKIFSCDSFKFVCDEPKFNSISKDLIEQSLLDCGYEIKNTINSIPVEKIKQIDELYVDFDIEKTYKIKLRTRPVFRSSC